IDQIVLRRADQAGMAYALRSGNDQFALSTVDGNGLTLLQELGNTVQLHTIPDARTANVLLRPADGVLANDDVRTAVAELIDRNKLIDKGAAGGPSASLRAEAQVLSPATPGYAATIPAGTGVPDVPRAEQSLNKAG